MVVYLDSSVALRAVLNVPERAAVRAWLDASDSTVVSSRLLQTELIRVLRRERRPATDAAPLLDRVGLVDISRETHSVAESIERHVKTLDALHLATAILLGSPVVVATHDHVMAAVAGYLGIVVTDPVTTS